MLPLCPSFAHALGNLQRRICSFKILITLIDHSALVSPLPVPAFSAFQGECVRGEGNDQQHVAKLRIATARRIVLRVRRPNAQLQSFSSSPPTISA